MKLPNLHRKGNAFYYVTGTKPRRWLPLGSDLQLALRRYERMRQSESPAGTVGALIQAWLANPPKTIMPSTLKSYRAYAGNIQRVFGEMYPDEVQRADVLRYMDECPRKSMAHEVMILRRVFERAVRQGVIAVNPCQGAKPETPVKTRRDRLISDAEFAAIRAAAPPLLQVAMDLAFCTSLRPGDLCRLRFSDIETGIKTRKTGVWLHFERTDDLTAILDAAKALQGSVAVLTVLSERGRPITVRRLRSLWDAACAAAGVECAQFRDLRARSASAEPETAQKRLGHTTPQMTKTYLRGRQVIHVTPLKRTAT